MSKNRMKELLIVLFHVPFLVLSILEAILLLFVPKSLRYKNLQGETVLITGGAGGLGRELAIKFSELGCRIVLLDINEVGMDETKRVIGESSTLVHTYTCDVSKRKDVYEVAGRIRREVGEVTILVNNAGVVTARKFMQCSDDMILKTFEVNTLSHFWTCKAFLSDMMANNHGHIVCISSLAGLGGGPRLTDYAASKHAIIGFMESLRVELDMEGFNGIKTTTVCPYHITTDLFDGFKTRLSRGLTPQYVADKTVAAVRLNKETIILPPFFITNFILKLLLPWSAMEIINEATGVNASMDKFKGRKTGHKTSA